MTTRTEVTKRATEARPPETEPGLQPESAWSRPDWHLLIALTAVAAMVILPNLGDRCLWEDEANTALLGKAILRTGLPRAWDGRLLVTAVYGAELTDSFLWKWHAWGSFYLAAAGMALAGPTPLGARLPFALLGCASIGLTYVVSRRLIRDRWAACLAAVLLLTTVQYLLLMRQARYYSMLSVGALGAVWGYVELPRRRGLLALTASMVFLFHSNYMTSVCVGLGIAVHALVWRRTLAVWLRLGAAALMTAAVTLPWFFAVGLHRSAGTLTAVGYHRDPTGKSLVKQLFAMNQFVCPWIVVVGLAAAAALGRLRVGGAYGLVACLALPVVTVVPVMLWAGPRYAVYMMPLGTIVVAAALREVYLRDDVVGNVAAIAAGVTNLLPSIACALMPSSVGATVLDGDFATGPGAIRQAMLKSEWAGYTQELREPYFGTDEAIAQFLLKNSNSDDIIYTTFEEMAFMFATNRRFAGLLKPAARDRPGWDKLPDYLFDRDAARFLVIRPAWLPLDGYEPLIRHWMERARRSGSQLIRHPLKVADTGWGNRPELRYHYFTSPGSNPSRDVSILELRPPERAQTRPSP